MLIHWLTNGVFFSTLQVYTEPKHPVNARLILVSSSYTGGPHFFRSKCNYLPKFKDKSLEGA